MSYEGLLGEDSGRFTIAAKMLRISTVCIDICLTMPSIYSFPLLCLCLDTFFNSYACSGYAIGF